MVKGPHSDAEDIGSIPGRETKTAVGHALQLEKPQALQGTASQPQQRPSTTTHTSKTPVEGESMRYQ